MAKKLFIAGHRGLVGSALVRCFSRQTGYEILVRTRKEVDLTDPHAVREFFDRERPDEVIDAAARVGGIKANNDYPVEFLLDNLRIQNNLMEESHRIGVSKFLFLGSSCIYPKFAPQPIPESALLTGPLEPTNEAYALAKITGIRLAQAYRREYGSHFICAMPTNVYGPYDNFNPETSHVLPGLIYKFHKAKTEKLPEVVLWGTGSPRREFIHSDDLAEACAFLMREYDDFDIVNVGTGEDVVIRDLAETIRQAVGFQGKIVWDTSYPDGTPRKLLDISRIKNMGWSPRVSLPEGIRTSYEWYQNHSVTK